MGCASSVNVSTRGDAAPASVTVNDKAPAPQKSGSAPLKETVPVDEGDLNAEVLTLGSCAGSIFDHYIIGRTLGARSPSSVLFRVPRAVSMGALTAVTAGIRMRNVSLR